MLGWNLWDEMTIFWMFNFKYLHVLQIQCYLHRSLWGFSLNIFCSTSSTNDLIMISLMAMTLLSLFTYILKTLLKCLHISTPLLKCRLSFVFQLPQNLKYKTLTMKVFTFFILLFQEEVSSGSISWDIFKKGKGSHFQRSWTCRKHTYIIY